MFEEDNRAKQRRNLVIISVIIIACSKGLFSLDGDLQFTTNIKIYKNELIVWTPLIFFYFWWRFSTSHLFLIKSTLRYLNTECGKLVGEYVVAYGRDIFSKLNIRDAGQTKFLPTNIGKAWITIPPYVDFPSSEQRDFCIKNNINIAGGQGNQTLYLTAPINAMIVFWAKAIWVSIISNPKFSEDIFPHFIALYAAFQLASNEQFATALPDWLSKLFGCI